MIVALCIAVGVATFLAGLLLAGLPEARRARQRIDELEDRLTAASLSEYRAHRPVAMPAHLPESDDEWLPDATGTGLFSEPAE